MKVFLLAGSTPEAASYAQAAGLRSGEFTYVATPQQVEGHRFDEGDLIAEFFSFKTHPLHEQIEDSLLASLAKNAPGSRPRWARIGQ